MLTHARLLELLKYNRATGVFTWRVDRAYHVRAGSEAGGLNNEGYVHIKIDRVLYKAHRLAWFYVYGVWPSHQIDHKNGDRSDNRWTKIRAANPSQNACNRKVRSDNSSGIPGVNWSIELRKWRVRVMKSGKRVLIGDFHSLDEASATRSKAAKKMHHEFELGRRV